MKTWIVAAAMAVGLATGASAKTGEWSVGLGMGAFGDTDGAFGFDTRYDVRGGAYLENHFELEGEISYFQGDVVFGDRESFTAAFANSVFSARPQKKVDPYGLLGLGWGSGSSGIGSGLTWQVGFGLKTWFGENRRGGLRIEWNWASVDEEGAQHADIGCFTIGGVFRIGKQ